MESLCVNNEIILFKQGWNVYKRVHAFGLAHFTYMKMSANKLLQP